MQSTLRAMQHAEPSRLRVVTPPDPRGDDLADAERGSPSPGRYLKEQRTRAGMSLDQLAAATKIPRASLESLEADEHDTLPGPVFVKGFLRCCARSLGVDPDTVMNLIYERERTLLLQRRTERAMPEAPLRPVPRPAAGDEHESLVQVWVQRAVGALPRVPGASLMMWFAVALLVAMVMMAAFNTLGRNMLEATV